MDAPRSLKRKAIASSSATFVARLASSSPFVVSRSPETSSSTPAATRSSARRQSDFAARSDDAIGVVSTPYARMRRINRLYRIDPSSARSNRRRLSRISGLLSLKTRDKTNG